MTSKRRNLLIVGTVAMASWVGFGTVMASVPDGDGLIHACYTEGPSGRVRIIDSATSACNPSETAVSWNQSGPPGPPGTGGIEAYLRISSTYDAASNTRTYQVDAARSKNIASVQFVPTRSGTGACITVAFEPKNIAVTGGGSFAPTAATRNIGLDQQTAGWSNAAAYEDCSGTSANAYLQSLGAEAWFTFLP